MKYIIAEADLTIVDINHSTDRVVQLLDQKGFEEKLNQDLANRVASKIECLAADAATDEQLAGRELTVTLCGASTTEIKTQNQIHFSPIIQFAKLDAVVKKFVQFISILPIWNKICELVEL